LTTTHLANALAALYARAPLGMRLGLEPMRAACARLGHPEQAFSAVHVAGTNGKGSVCAMVEAIARADGLKTGLYTSPHLCRFSERIRVDGEPLADRALATQLDAAVAAAPDLRFFEVATLAAFLAFRAAKVDLAVLEVGLGGRLDATNVVPAPRAAAVTRIALDHTAILGGTLAAIAREKAGIAKPGMEIVLGPAMPREARDTIDEVARAAGAHTFAIDEDTEARAFVDGGAQIGLAGEHQRDNARIAWRLAERAGLGERARAEGIAAVRWPARLERIETEDGEVLLDGAHNPDGAESLARYLRSEGHRRDEIAMVFGALADKAWPEMLDVLAPLAASRVYVAPAGGPRSAAVPAEMAARHAGDVAGTMAEAVALARKRAGPFGLVVVCGSLYLVGEARALLLGLPRDPPVAL
jgi:dihydrofolate synthase/folylpolyglutamate synthase